jgi:fructose-1,6-bisphosphatase/inositol monophosphatase family enzyme
MIDARDADEIERIIRTVAEREVEPWFGRLTATDIVEKAPGDLVTVADRAAEAALTVALEAVVPGSVTVGEEAVAADPTVQAALDGDAPVWVIDPIDGTHNFATDNPRFAMLVALAHRGELLASWTYAPALDLMATARRGAGATSTASGCGWPRRPTPCATSMSARPSRSGGRAPTGPGSTGSRGPGSRCASSTRPAWSTSSSPPAGARR